MPKKDQTKKIEKVLRCARLVIECPTKGDYKEGVSREWAICELNRALYELDGKWTETKLA